MDIQIKFGGRLEYLYIYPRELRQITTYVQDWSLMTDSITYISVAINY